MAVTRKTSRVAVVVAVTLILLVAACEPFAPETDQQSVIVITSSPTSELAPSPTPPLTTSLPTRPPPTATPTVASPLLPTLEPCDELTGRVINNGFTSQLAGGEVPYRVYVPPCFFQTLRRYPYVILLHGSGFDFTQWTDEVGIQLVLDQRIGSDVNPLPPMVIVMPEGGELQESNFFEAGQSFEDLILNELIPEIERQFCVWTTADGRAIGGISRGGFWATSIAFRNPDMFSAIGGHSPFYVDDNAPPTHNPLDLANTVDATTPLRIYLDNARSDIGGENVIRLSNILRANGVQHTYEISPTGGHDNAYWAAHVSDYLDFYGRDWPVDAAQLPSCFE
jgi:enterochelin esterase-like enzyme